MSQQTSMPGDNTLVANTLEINVRDGEEPNEEAWAPNGQEPTLSGHFRLHQGFQSKLLDHARDIIVYLPPSYAHDPDRRYPILYMNDGNNLFNAATAMGDEWNVDEHMEHLIGSGQIEEALIVGIYNTENRDFEYTWNAMTNEDGSVEGGGGPRYARFIVEELKPFIDAEYRTKTARESTGIAGSSLGGLISFYMGLHYADVFSHIGVVSPSLWWNNEQSLADVETLPDDLKIWVDMGTDEGGDPEETLAKTQSFVECIASKGYVQGENLLFWLAEGADHSEASWSERVDRMLFFFFGHNNPNASPQLEIES